MRQVLQSQAPTAAPTASCTSPRRDAIQRAADADPANAVEDHAAHHDADDDIPSEPFIVRPARTGGPPPCAF
jgi:hypothetical protein